MIVHVTFSFGCSRPSRVRLEVDIISLVEYLVEFQVAMECKGIVCGKNVSEEKERWSTQVDYIVLEKYLQGYMYGCSILPL